jgi:hypothetical protein
VTKFKDIVKLISWLDKFPIHGLKSRDYQDWCRLHQL